MGFDREERRIHIIGVQILTHRVLFGVATALAAAALLLAPEALETLQKACGGPEIC